jgi:DNA (cytosine-5)-methyltransferase 1
MTLTVGSLFSGIGGLDLGLERAGMNVIWQSEIDPYACRVLKKHWPEVPNYGDIKQINWGDVVQPDVVCGGYPCQPFSTAGKRQGENDPRHLWPWVREAISQLRPQYAILENVRGHLTMGGTTVIGELAAIGYDCEWRVVSAASVGANHRRDRIIIVAYPNNARPHSAKVNPTEIGEYAQRGLGRCGTDVANTEGGDGRNSEPHGVCTVYGQATELREQGRLYGFHSDWWEVEPDVGRVANGVPNRVDRLRGLGNAVVPQVAEVIGRLVVEHATHN